MMGLATHTLILGALLGVLSTPWQAAGSCAALPSASSTAGGCCCCLKAAATAAKLPACCQARAARVARTCCQQKSADTATLGCRCQHAPAPAVPASTGTSGQELQTCFAAAADALPVAAPRAGDALQRTVSDNPSHLGPSVQALLCRWTV